MFPNTVAAALVALPLVAQAVYAQEPLCTREYTVRQGETCNAIGAAEGASTFQILAVNNGVVDPLCYNLVPDQNICLGTEGADCTETHVVGENDTCAAILEKYDIDASTLWTNNPNIDTECYNIYIGEVLCVSKDILVPDVPEGFFKYESIATNPNPHPETPYVPQPDSSEDLNIVENVDGSYQSTDEYEVIDESQLEEGEELVYCDQVGVKV